MNHNNYPLLWMDIKHNTYVRFYVASLDFGYLITQIDFGNGKWDTVPVDDVYLYDIKQAEQSTKIKQKMDNLNNVNITNNKNDKYYFTYKVYLSDKQIKNIARAKVKNYDGDTFDANDVELFDIMPII